MAEPTKMPFGVWTWEGPGNYGLGGGPDPPREGAVLRASPCPMKIIGNVQQQPKLLDRWQQQCSVLLPILQ